MTTAANLIPSLRFKSWLSTGQPNAFGTLTSYAASSVTPLATFTDSTATQQNPNPLQLNSRGEGYVWTPPNVAYKFIEQDQFGNQIGSTDQVVNSVLTTLWAGSDTGTANAYQLSFSGPYASLVNGIVLYWTAANTNTGASTLSITVNGTPLGGAVPILNQSGTPLGSGQIVANGITAVIYYNGAWLLTSAAGSIPLAGSFLGTLNGGTGGSVNPASCTYAITGNIASVFLPYMNVLVGPGGILVMNGLPTILQPSTHVQTVVVPLASGNITGTCLAQISPGSSNIVFYNNFPSQTWSGAASIGIQTFPFTFGQTLVWGLS